MKYFRFVLLMLSFSKCVLNVKISQPSDPFYIAGVVEFPALGSNYDPDDTIDRISKFRRLIESSEIHPDIIVFPENVLNNRTYPIVVPHPELEIVPCAKAEYDYIITEISCYARSMQTYLLINVVEVERNCSVLGANTYCPVYNTNVVFDRSGVVISRYRKYNLIGAEWQYFNYTQHPEEEALFKTDFNVTFGHFTRMDLLYYRPAQALVAKGISDFLHPSKWQSELPFMTAMQLHQSWAYSNNVNLLVAGTNDPLNGRTGTGIYAAQYGALIASMTTNATKSKLYVSVLPKRGYDLFNVAAQHATGVLLRSSRPPHVKEVEMEMPLQRQEYPNTTLTQSTDRITGVNLGRDSDIDLYTTINLSETSDDVHQTICHNDLCCDFDIKRSAISNLNASMLEGAGATAYNYRLATFKGLGTFLNTEPDAVAVCALFACVGDHLYTCGRIFPETTLLENRFVFDYIQISGNFTQRLAKLILPTSVDGMLMPLPVNAFEFQVHEKNNVSFVNYTLLQPKTDLLTFGIYVNYFLDETIYDQHVKDDANGLNIVHLTLLLLCILVSNYLF